MTSAVDPSLAYADAVLTRAANDLGAPIPPGTTVVGSADRDGSSVAVVYPLVDRTIVWCALAVAERVRVLDSSRPSTTDEILEAVAALGGSFAGAGNHRVMRGTPRLVHVDGFHLVELDRDLAADRALLADFVAACPDDDLDEAELEMDDLDPAIVALVDDNGAIASYASARPWEIASEFDDIAVITRPDVRGRGLGAAAVGEFSRRRLDVGRLLFYSCDVDNAGSNATAERVGFDLVCTVAAIDLG